MADGEHMGRIRVTGGREEELDRRALERARSGRLPAGTDRAALPVCTGPFTTLVLDLDGTVYPCAGTGRPLIQRRATDLGQVYRGANAEALRQELRSGRMPADHCAACIERCRFDVPGAAAVIAVHGHLVPDGSCDGPIELILRLDGQPRKGGVAALKKRIASIVGTLRCVEIICPDPSTDRVADAVFELLAAAPVPPSVALRLEELDRPESLVERLRGLRLARCEIGSCGRIEAPIAIAREQLPEGVRPVVRHLLRPEDWFDYLVVARRAAAMGADVRFDVSTLRGETPVLALSLSEQRVVVSTLAMTHPLFSGDQRPKSVAPGAFDLLRAELRRVVSSAASEVLYTEPGALAGGVAEFRLPPVDHPGLADPVFARAIVSAVAYCSDTRAIQRWAETVAADERGQELAATSPVVRLLLHRGAEAGASEAVLGLLRRLYKSAPERRERVGRDEACAREFGIAGPAASWSEWLGLARMTARQRPWAIGPARRAPSGSRADVTVLIPSFKHEGFVVDAIRSVLAQTYAALVVHVVDDCSPDGTVGAAQQVRDKRVLLRTNEQNLGLANSVLQALEQVETPYVALLNSDDLFHPERIARCRQVLEDDPDAAVVATGLELIDDSGRRIHPRNVSRLVDGVAIHDWVHWFAGVCEAADEGAPLFERLLRNNFLITSSNVFCRTDFLRSCAEDLAGLKYCLDWQLLLEAGRREVLRVVAEPLLAYRLHRTNTVWFQGGRRWSYYLETNRVAARSLHRFVEGHGGAGAGRDALRLTVEQLVRNTELDGFGALLSEVVGGRELERVAEADDAARALVEQMSARSTRLIRMADAIRDVPDATLERDVWELRRLEMFRASRLLLEITAEDAGVSRGEARWARNEVMSLRERASEMQAHLTRFQAVEQGVLARIRDTLGQPPGSGARAADSPGADAEVADAAWGLARTVDLWIREVGSLRERLATESAGHEARERELASELEQLRASATALEQRLSERASGLEAELDGARGDLQELQREVVALRTREAELVARLDANAAVIASERRLHEELESSLRVEREGRERASDAERRLHAELGALRRAEAGLQDSLRSLNDERSRVAAALHRDRPAEAAPVHEVAPQGPASGLHRARHDVQEAERALRLARVEFDRLRGSTEWRIGWFIWTKIPFFAKSRRFSRAAYRRVREACGRSMLNLKKMFRREARRAPFKIAAGATAQFPVISHTFVYQELTAMHQMMSADVRVFHTQQGDRASMHEAFSYLDGNRDCVHPEWEVHKADFDHYCKVAPEKVDSLLAAISEHSGIAREELETRFEILLGFTYARRHALWGAEYVHSYFFYDQALCALVSAWMNDIPRGLSTYADHMMQDWPLKVTALHLQTADVIVATSRRIRDELIGIGGAGIADKVIVKPNGVDGRRFVYVQRQPVIDRPLEIACVTRIEPKKGMLELVDAAKILKDRGREFRIHVIGSADAESEASRSYAAEFEARIVDLGVDEVVIRHGRMVQEKLRPLLEKCDVFAAPFVETAAGDKDGIPTAILEAMAMGLPVAATTAGSIPEILDEGKEGFLVPQRDPEALATAIERFIDDPQLAPRLGRAARERFDREFDIRATEPLLHERVRAALSRRRVVTQ